jgi:hypothetical protein
MSDKSLSNQGKRLAGHALVEALIANGVTVSFGVPNDAQYLL